jgi:hypothetical protein
MKYSDETGLNFEALRPPQESGTGQTKDQAWLSALIDEVVTREDWHRLIRRLARSKSVRAKQLLVRYRFGRASLANAAPSTKNTFFPLSDVLKLPPIEAEEDEYDPDRDTAGPLPSDAK